MLRTYSTIAKLYSHFANNSFYRNLIYLMIFTAIATFFSVLILHFYLTAGFYGLLVTLFIFMSIGMILQVSIILWWMLYAWDYPERTESNKSPDIYTNPELSFSAIIPARNEAKVIGQTITALASIDYPEELKETIIVCRGDDSSTIDEVKKTIEILNNKNIKIAIYNDLPINKPHALSIGCKLASNDIVVIFDAEDEPHPEIYNIANTLFIEKHADVIQSGVQLMDFQSHWYSMLNVLEYYFWFKSILSFFADNGFITLGGNTVFFKKQLLSVAGGWDENCLTEDADIGVRISALGAKTIVVYDEAHTTHEETPHSVASFIRQRTRWRQGFMQVFLKGDWKKLPGMRKKVLAGLVFLSPFIELLLLLYLPFSIIIIMYEKLPVVIVMFSFLPLYLMFLQILLCIIGSFKFCRDYRLKYPFYMPVQIVLTFFPYQLLLGMSVLRATSRILTKQKTWENTLHFNAHR